MLESFSTKRNKIAKMDLVKILKAWKTTLEELA